MRSRIFWAAAVTAAALAAMTSAATPAHSQVPGQPPEYRLRIDPENSQVHVRIELDVENEEAIHLLFRGEWDGYPGLAKRLQPLEAWGPHGTLEVQAKAEDLDSGHRRVKLDGPGRVTINYTMVMTPPPESRFYHRVSQLSPSGGHLIGRDLLPRIWFNKPQAGSHSARIRIDGMPRDWRAVTTADRTGGAYSIADIGSAVIVVGPLRSRRINIGHRSLTAAVHGEWPVDDAVIVDAIERIAGALHRITRDGWAPGDYLLGAGRVPASIRGLSTGGQVIGNSGLVYVGGTGPGALEFNRWLHTTAHELMHWYIPTGFVFDGAPPSWFAEGFTDYFSLKILLAGELIGPEEFLAEIADRLNRYRASPLYGVTSVSDAQADFWDDNSYRFIYDGGAVAAFLLDIGFQARGQSLERVLGDIRNGGAVTNESLSVALGSVRENEWINAWLAGEGNPDWDVELARYRLSWNGSTLVSSDGWATDVLGNIRP